MPIERTAPPIAPSPQTPLDLNEVRRDPKRANLLYHDVAAPGYDRKWAISFDDRGTGYMRQRARRMLPRHRYGRVLEMGAGTGFMLLNLWRGACGSRGPPPANFCMRRGFAGCLRPSGFRIRCVATCAD